MGEGIRPGTAWEQPADAATAVPVVGDDAALAAAVAAAPDGVLVAFRPAAGSAVAATLGLRPAPAADAALAVAPDALAVRIGGVEHVAVASVVAGVDPHDLRRHHRLRTVVIDAGRGTTTVRSLGVVVLTTQHLGGDRLVRRGHPGDGRAEIEWYGVPGAQRRLLRARLATGDHLDHPDVGVLSVRRATLAFDRPVPIRVDGVPRGRARELEVVVLPSRYRILV